MSPRRDEGIKFASVVKGLRMEPDLAAKFTDYVKSAGENAAAAARILLRIGLGASEADSVISEAQATNLRKGKIAGLSLDETLEHALASYANDFAKLHGSYTMAGATRHVLRLQLGIQASESLRRERVFTSIATSRRKLAESIP